MKFVWPESARAELRAIDRDAAGRILRALTQYGESGAGDVKALTGQWQGYSGFAPGTTASYSAYPLTKSPLFVFAIAPKFTGETRRPQP